MTGFIFDIGICDAARKLRMPLFDLVDLCDANPGFVVGQAEQWIIPAEFVERVKRGERPADVAAEIARRAAPAG